MTRQVRKAAIGHAFGKYVPKVFAAQGRKEKPGGATDKDIAFYRRQLHSDRTLETREEQLRFERGLLKEAHAMQSEERALRLREGLNPVGHETEQAQRELKSFRASQTPPPEKAHAAAEQGPNPLEMIRARLGIQHSALGSAAPAAPAWQAPSHLGDQRPSNQPPAGKGWTSSNSSPSNNQPAPSTPAFGAPASGLTGGRITLPEHPDKPISRVIPAEPSGSPAVFKPEPPTPAPPATSPDLPDPGQVHELPI